MPSWSQLVCQLCFPASLQRATLPGRAQPTQGTTNTGHPHKSQLENCGLGKSANRTHSGRRNQGGRHVNEGVDPVAGCCCNRSSSGRSSSSSSSGTRDCCRISMWLLCRRRWSRRASAGPPSGSPLRVGQIGSATNRRRRLMPRTGSPRMCQHEVQVWDISLPAIVVGCE